MELRSALRRLDRPRYRPRPSAAVHRTPQPPNASSHPARQEARETAAREVGWRSATRSGPRGASPPAEALSQRGAPRSSGATLLAYGTEWIRGIEDIRDFVAEERDVLARHPEDLATPSERVLLLTPGVAARLGADPQPEAGAQKEMGSPHLLR